MSGDFLPGVQTDTDFKFPNDWYSSFPILCKKLSELVLPLDYRAMVLFEKGSVHAEEILTLSDDNHINVIIIPTNCTDRLQPLDLVDNKSACSKCNGTMFLSYLLLQL